MLSVQVSLVLVRERPRRCFMCQSKEQGGRRCATHLREPYQLAINRVFRYGRTVKDVDALLAIATEYAGTVEGAKKITNDIERNKQKLELSMTLKRALKKAEEIKTAEEQADILIRKAKGDSGKEPIKSYSDNNGIAPEPISWKASEPIWPNRETTAEAVKDFHGTPEEKQFVMKAYRSLFKIQWHNLFFQTSGEAQPPRDNKEGWEWRRQATDAANHQIIGARVISVSEAQVGMTVYNGFGVKTIKSIMIGSEVDWMDNGEKRKAKGFRFVYNEIAPITSLPAYARWVLLPNCKVL